MRMTIFPHNLLVITSAQHKILQDFYRRGYTVRTTQTFAHPWTGNVERTTIFLNQPKGFKGYLIILPDATICYTDTRKLHPNRNPRVLNQYCWPFSRTCDEAVVG